MKSSITSLGATVEAAVAHELGEPMGDPAIHLDSQRRRNVAGLRVVSNASRDAATDKSAAALYRSLTLFRADAKILKDKLARAGVKPIALLPLTAWTRLCDQAKLYRLNPNKDGAVHISSTTLDEARVKAEKAKVKTPSPAWGLLAPAVIFPLAVWLCYRGLDSLIAFFFACLISLLLGVAIGGPLEERQKAGREKLVQENLRTSLDEAKTNGSLHDLLWPGLTEPSEGPLLRIALPEAPEDVQAIIIAAERAGVLLRLATVGDAIALREDPLNVLLTHYARELEIEALARDPIVYVVEGSAVAVIAQFGDFPIEQEVVNEVVNSIHLA